VSMRATGDESGGQQLRACPGGAPPPLCLPCSACRATGAGALPSSQPSSDQPLPVQQVHCGRRLLRPVCGGGASRGAAARRQQAGHVRAAASRCGTCVPRPHTRHRTHVAIQSMLHGTWLPRPQKAHGLWRHAHSRPEAAAHGQQAPSSSPPCPPPARSLAQARGVPERGRHHRRGRADHSGQAMPLQHPGGGGGLPAGHAWAGGLCQAVGARSVRREWRARRRLLRLLQCGTGASLGDAWACIRLACANSAHLRHLRARQGSRVWLAPPTHRHTRARRAPAGGGSGGRAGAAGRQLPASAADATQSAQLHGRRDPGGAVER
jgi:hypothetical protein